MKHFLGMDVFAAARLRLEEIFDSFERVYVSFSGGKDSGLVVQYALEISRETRFPRCNRIGCAGILTRGSCGFVSSPGIRG